MLRRIGLGILICSLSVACAVGTIGQEQSTQIAPAAPSPMAPTITPTPTLPPGWTTFTNGNDVNDMAFDHAGNLWAATTGGLVRWTAGGTYTKYTTIDGLPDNDVGSVAVAPDGAVWLGSFESGLVRFDPASSGHGGTRTTFTTAHGLPDDRIWDAAVAPDGTVWVSTYDSGVTRLDVSALPEIVWTTYTAEDGLLNGDVYGIAIAPDGLVWAYGGSGVSRFKDERWTTFTSANGLSGDYVNAIGAVPGGAVWIGANNGVSYFDGTVASGEAWAAYADKDSVIFNGISSIVVAPDGIVWFGTTTHGLLRFDGTKAPGEAWSTYTEKDGLPGDMADHIAIAPDGAVWISTAILDERRNSWIGQGVSRLYDGKWTTYTTDDKLTGNQVTDTVMTSDGMLWFFTENGVSCLDPSAGSEWITCPGDGLGITINSSITRAPDGSLWTLTYPGIARYDPSAGSGRDGAGWTTYSLEGELASASLWNLTIAPDGSVWVGVYFCAARAGCVGQGVARLDPAASSGGGVEWSTYTVADGLAGDLVNDIAIAADGSLWFGTNGGMSHLEDTGASSPTWTTYDIDTLLSGVGNSAYNPVYSVITLPDGSVCCEIIGAVSCFDGKSWTAYTEADGLYPEHDSLGGGIHIILSTAVDQDGALWLGTNGGGVARFDGETWRTYTTADGLAGNQVNTIAVAPDGAVWVGTLNGASRFNGSTWTTFTAADGLADNGVQDIVVAPDGSLWFGTYSGVSRYGPPQ